MAFWNNRNMLLGAVDDWVGRKVITASTGNSLKIDIESNLKKRSFSWVVTLLGVICLAFFFMTFVAGETIYNEPLY